MTTQKKWLLLSAIAVLWSVATVATAQTNSGGQVPATDSTSQATTITAPAPQPTATSLTVSNHPSCPQYCHCDAQGKALYCESVPSTSQPNPVAQPGTGTIPAPQPAASSQTGSQPTPSVVSVPVPSSVQWSTATVPVKIEISSAETSISGPQATATKVPENCTLQGQTMVCPTSQEKQITVPVMSGASGGGTVPAVQAVMIQKQADGVVGITSQGVTAVTPEKVTVENNQLFVGASGGGQSVKILPAEAQTNAALSAGLTSIASTELKTEGQRPVYTVHGTRMVKLLFLFPIKLETTTKIDATNGQMVSVQKPWWSFFAR